MKNPIPETNMILYWNLVILLSSSAAKVPEPATDGLAMQKSLKYFLQFRIERGVNGR